MTPQSALFKSKTISFILKKKSWETRSNPQSFTVYFHSVTASQINTPLHTHYNYGVESSVGIGTRDINFVVAY